MLLPVYILILSLTSIPPSSTAPTSNSPPLTITGPTLSSSTNYTTNDLLTRNFHCLDLLNPFTPRPKSRDCQTAIHLLPSFDGHGSFHNQGPPDPFLLPVSKTSNTCTVRVEMLAGSATTGGSWVDLRAVAEELNARCFGMVLLPLFKGGWASYGKQKRVVISLSYARRGDGEDDDEDDDRGDGGGGSVDSMR